MRRMLRPRYLLLIAVVLLAGCGGKEMTWQDVPGGQMGQVDLLYKGQRLSCFVYDGDYAGNLECHRAFETVAAETITVPDDGHWVSFSAGQVRLIRTFIRDVPKVCLEFDGDYRGSINCPDEINPRQRG